MKPGITLLCRQGKLNQKIDLPSNPTAYMSTMPIGTVMEHTVPTGRKGCKAYQKTFWTTKSQGKVQINKSFSNCL